MKTKRHSSLLNQLDSQPSISTTFAQPQRVDERASAAELLFTKFVVEHNLPFLVADHFSKLTKVIFPDSKIAAAYASARTKTTAIVTHALAPAMRKIVDIACRSQPFTILCDGGNDRVDRKYFAILVPFGMMYKVSLSPDSLRCQYATSQPQRIYWKQSIRQWST